jgi:hypothetical protein
MKIHHSLVAMSLSATWHLESVLERSAGANECDMSLLTSGRCRLCPFVGPGVVGV